MKYSEYAGYFSKLERDINALSASEVLAHIPRAFVVQGFDILRYRLTEKSDDFDSDYESDPIGDDDCTYRHVSGKLLLRIRKVSDTPDQNIDALVNFISDAGEGAAFKEAFLSFSRTNPNPWSTVYIPLVLERAV